LELGIPENLICKTPSDGLTGLTDEQKYGFTYKVLDEYIKTGKCDNAEIKEKIDRMHKNSRHKFEEI
jgi:NAD+ synthase